MQPLPTWIASLLTLSLCGYTTPICEQKKLINGETAYIDQRYKDRSYAEKILVEIMEKCWAFKPEDRIDIFEAARLLREAVKENERLERETVKP